MTVQQQRAAVTLAPLTIRERGLGPGVCGRLTGTALVFGVVDAYGTLFAPGCLADADATARAGRLQLYCDHTYGVRTHVGVVRGITSTPEEARFTADLFDTDDGRRAKDYLRAVVAAGSLAGVSIGFAPLESERLKGGGERFLRVRLEELSITPRPAVPGAAVDAVRHRPRTRLVSWEDRLRAVAALERAEVEALGRRVAWRATLARGLARRRGRVA